jgi:hypothetical protein
VAAPKDLWLDTSKPYFRNPTNATTGCTDPVSLLYDGSNSGGGGNGNNGNGNGQPFKDKYFYLRITDSGGVPRYNKSFVNGGGQINGICLPQGGYLATLYFCNAETACSTSYSDRERVQEKVLVTYGTVPAYTPLSHPAPNGPNQYIQKSPELTEVKFLNTLANGFCPYMYDNATVAAMAGAPSYSSRCGGPPSRTGDVFPDTVEVMNNELPKRLVADPTNCNSPARYDITNVIVAGSNMQQSSMLYSAVKVCLANWVSHGGVLIVLGSYNQNADWLNAILPLMIDSSSNGLSTPDVGHPLLHTSDGLDYPSYSGHGQVWRFTGPTATETAKRFTNVVSSGSDPVTAISNSGAVGNGTVILTTWRAFDPYNGTSSAATTEAEGLRLTNNLLMQGYRTLFLDYGPPLPANTNVVPATRTVEIKHPLFAEPIQLSVVVYVFK